jgi:hypothetical protein
VIVSRGNGRYDVMSEDGSKRLGKNLSKKKAEARIRAVEYFKHRDEKRRINRRA